MHLYELNKLLILKYYGCFLTIFRRKNENFQKKVEIFIVNTVFNIFFCGKFE